MCHILVLCCIFTTAYASPLPPGRVDGGVVESGFTKHRVVPALHSTANLGVGPASGGALGPTLGTNAGSAVSSGSSVTSVSKVNTPLGGRTEVRRDSVASSRGGIGHPLGTGGVTAIRRDSVGESRSIAHSPLGGRITEVDGDRSSILTSRSAKYLQTPVIAAQPAVITPVLVTHSRRPIVHTPLGYGSRVDVRTSEVEYSGY